MKNTAFESLEYVFSRWRPTSLTNRFSNLIGRKDPEHSLPGIVLACASLVVMPILSRAKKDVGKKLGSAAMNADAKHTDFCVYLSALLLAGLLLNTVLGWWWADPAAALIMVPMIAKEGVDGIKGKACDDCSAAARSQ